MSGLFEHMAATDDAQRVERRKAIALARARATRRFARFIEQGDRNERLALVAGDMRDTVRQACAEVGYTDWESVFDSITASFGGMEHEAVRKPKMCPFHREVTDISLAAGDPSAGFNAMAGHAWGPQHCQGSEYEGGRCNFKPEMTTQSYWDQKEEKAKERREQREREQAEQQALEAQPEVTEDPIEEPLADAPDAQPEYDLPADSAIEDYSGQLEGGDLATAPREPAMASTRQAEALKTVDVAVGEGPEPKMDKRKWTPQNIQWDQNAEMAGTPHPTRQQDVTQRAEYVADGADRLDQTRAVTETQDVLEQTGPGRQAEQGSGQWTNNNGQTNPVTMTMAASEGFRNLIAATDPDKNPFAKDDEDEEEKDEQS